MNSSLLTSFFASATLLFSSVSFSQTQEETLSKKIFEFALYNQHNELKLFLMDLTNQHGINYVHSLVETPRKVVEKEKDKNGNIVDVTYFERPIETAAMINHDRVVELLIQFGADPNGEDPNGAFPLLLTSQFNHIKTARVLIKHGADINKQTKFWGGVTTLIRASILKHADFVEFLLLHKANPNLTDDEGNTALHLATVWPEPAWWATDNTKVIQLLVAANANLEQENNMGQTPLYLAVQRGTSSEVAKFLELGADPDHESLTGLSVFTPRQLAKSNVFQQLREGKPINNTRKVYSLFEQY
jgi:ankyrin repeat protein